MLYQDAKESAVDYAAYCILSVEQLSYGLSTCINYQDASPRFPTPLSSNGICTRRMPVGVMRSGIASLLYYLWSILNGFPPRRIYSLAGLILTIPVFMAGPSESTFTTIGQKDNSERYQLLSPPPCISSSHSPNTNTSYFTSNPTSCSFTPISPLFTSCTDACLGPSFNSPTNFSIFSDTPCASPSTYQSRYFSCSSFPVYPRPLWHKQTEIKTGRIYKVEKK